MGQTARNARLIRFAALASAVIWFELSAAPAPLVAGAARI